MNYYFWTLRNVPNKLNSIVEIHAILKVIWKYLIISQKSFLSHLLFLVKNSIHFFHFLGIKIRLLGITFFLSRFHVILHFIATIILRGYA